jgi:hypothetical protein
VNDINHVSRSRDDASKSLAKLRLPHHNRDSITTVAHLFLWCAIVVSDCKRTRLFLRAPLPTCFCRASRLSALALGTQSVIETLVYLRNKKKANAGIKPF